MSSSEVLHAALQDGLTESVDEIQTNGAIQLQNGWMHVHGMLIPPPILTKFSEMCLLLEELVIQMRYISMSDLASAIGTSWFHHTLKTSRRRRDCEAWSGPMIEDAYRQSTCVCFHHKINLGSRSVPPCSPRGIHISIAPVTLW